MRQELVAQQNFSSSGRYDILAEVWITAQKKFQKSWLLLQSLQGIHISIVSWKDIIQLTVKIRK